MVDFPTPPFEFASARIMRLSQTEESLLASLFVCSQVCKLTYLFVYKLVSLFASKLASLNERVSKPPIRSPLFHLGKGAGNMRVIDGQNIVVRAESVNR
jgi:hypothetical protein